jgi:hypothetical protein
LSPTISARETHVRWALKKSSGLSTGTSFVYTLNQPAGVRLTFTTQLEGRREQGRCVRSTRANLQRSRRVHDPSLRRGHRAASQARARPLSGHDHRSRQRPERLYGAQFHDREWR